MADYKEKFEKWQREAKDRFEDFDKQIGLKEKIEESAKTLKETAQKGAETFKESAKKIKTEAEKSEVGKQAYKVAEDTFKNAEEGAKKAWNASEPIRHAAEDAGEKAADVFSKSAVEAESVLRTVGQKAGEVFDVASIKANEVFEEARDSFGTTANRVSKAFSLGASWTRTIDSAIKTVQKTSGWISENPLQAATTGVSMAVGAGLGVVVTGISSHWLFNSALPAWSVQKASEQFQSYLKNQDELIKKGELSQAEAEKIQFERDIAKYVGAPLLGAYSFASGAVMMTNIFNPKTITGAPIDWLLGGNPLLEGVWFFGNGVICLKTGYEFFMFALEDQEDVQRIVKELKGLLPA
ncbi:MAG: hypothetical protein M3521_12050 [Acidobacteriota bacterium]|jgi:ElaB/YqjD/DUF883 family membrane-anchored ribosome-binding protein|nr:hypothetical protein [Acidobacteriota bacterium]MDQ3374604.1 hypothetical protein [Acidobacteriota bacterium]